MKLKNSNKKFDYEDEKSGFSSSIDNKFKGVCIYNII